MPIARSALLRRGAHPYAVIADDIQKDDQSHCYEFILRLPDDLENQVQVVGTLLDGLRYWLSDCPRPAESTLPALV